MAPTLRWQSSTGRNTISEIVKKLLPEWTSGLRPVQEELVSDILDSDDVLCCTATGDGKSCAFYIPILVLSEYNTNRAEYPSGLPTRPNPRILCVPSPEYNEETIRLIDEDPELQIILATIAFANGINASSLLASVTVGSSGSSDTTYQEKGRVCRKAGARGRGVLLVSKSSIAQALKFLKTLPSTSSPQPKKKGVGKLTSSELMTCEKAELITEAHCYNAFWNRLYQNPPLETSTLDCITTNRPLPCELCRVRTNKTLLFPAPDSAPNFPPLTPLTAPKPPARVPKKLKLTRKERESGEKKLKRFRDVLGVTEQRMGRFLEHPRIMFLPYPFVRLF
ncbi:hypothetical protein B0H16DRAFT_1761928 [Mycena metata]|uniref:DEAD/DEAH-box helicase domain-containing protein n=1 Tax=Mycena metata TaxID=1033252 RepID=A0AAD7MYM3_9AGAR|nr:hypothetical protein B0H16DRAFT_1761928 [Mycena metata]